ncbi:MAG TPA: polyprenyl synthetase family protein [Bacteroidota bacterium]
MDFLQRYKEYVSIVDEYLSTFVKKTIPRSLYDPASYILAAGGKRIRPVLVLCACEAVGGNREKAIHAAAGLEILHNFTLVHDDIMDNAASRRGRATVHTKWDSNVAILAGDVLLGLAYRALLQSETPAIQELGRIFTEGVIEVCEGQAYDKEFETRRKVSLDEYLLMIQKKTGTMVAVATEVGAILGDGSAGEREALKSYGKLVGEAFQVQDDLLDVLADEKKFGKTIGGDIVEGKKTYLLITALQRAKGAEKKLLQKLVQDGGISKKHVDRIRRIFLSTGAVEAAGIHVANNIAKAKEQLKALNDTESAHTLSWFADMLLSRKS